MKQLTASIYGLVYSRKGLKFLFLFMFGLTLLLLSDLSFAGSLGEELDKVNALTTGKLKKFGLSGATICGGIWSVFKGNVKLAGVIVAIGVILSCYLSWIDGGMLIDAVG